MAGIQKHIIKADSTNSVLVVEWMPKLLDEHYVQWPSEVVGKICGHGYRPARNGYNHNIVMLVLFQMWNQLLCCIVSVTKHEIFPV